MKARKGGFTLVELLIVIMIIAILAGMMLLATGSATENAEATKVINDLRNVKGAALMYYAENNSWPGAAAAIDATTSIEPYMDRSFDVAKYGQVQVGAELADGRQFIGFPTLTVPNGVKNKLASKATDSGLFGTNAGGNYTNASAGVFMNMK